MAFDNFVFAKSLQDTRVKLKVITDFLATYNECGNIHVKLIQGLKGTRNTHYILFPFTHRDFGKALSTKKFAPL